MLNKLLKYEIKATGRIFLPLFLMLFIFAAINRILRVIPDTNGNSFNARNIAFVISMIVYVMLFAGMVAGTLIIMIQRFYKNLLGNSGYLMFTLPVKTWEHILGKLLVAMMWTILSIIVGVCTILIIAYERNLFSDIANGWERFIHTFMNANKTLNIYLLGFESIILVILGLASNILQIYAAIMLGHLFNKHKLLLSFVMYIVLNTAVQIITMILAFILQGPFSNIIPENISQNALIQTGVISVLVFVALLSAGYYVITHYLLKNKLNLE